MSSSTRWLANALALLNARTAFRPAAMKAYIAKKMTSASASTVTDGQADP